MDASKSKPHPWVYIGRALTRPVLFGRQGVSLSPQPFGIQAKISDIFCLI
jgi:hypothetical protein